MAEKNEATDAHQDAVIHLLLTNEKCLTRWIEDNDPPAEDFREDVRAIVEAIRETWQRSQVLLKRETFNNYLETRRIPKMLKAALISGFSRIKTTVMVKAEDFDAYRDRMRADKRHALRVQAGEALSAGMTDMARMLMDDKDDPTQANFERIERKLGELKASTQIDLLPLASARDYPATDVGNAELFAHTHGRDCRYVGDWKAWIVWDGRRWKRDTTETVRARACHLARDGMYDIARRIKDDDARTKYTKHIASSQQRARIDNMISLAQTQLAIESAQLDQDPWALNSVNGTIDLQTGSLREHRRDDLITKLSPITYDAAATCPTWQAFLARIFQDTDGQTRQDLVRYVQTAAGYTLTGDVTEHALWMLHGTGRNGKTTLLDALKYIMGDYALTAQQQLLLKTREKSNSEDEANLFGVRLAVSSETNEGQRFDEVTVKRLIGGGRIRARRLYENSFEFAPTHKIWMDCNHLPQIGGSDLGIWRRIKCIPFVVTIPTAEVDARLPDKLRAEANGILNWMLAGLAAWRDAGINEPADVTAAVKEYMGDNDTFGQFLADCTTDNPAGQTRVTALYAIYLDWCRGNGLEHPLTQPSLAKKLKARGYQQGGGRRHWRGLEIIRDTANSREEVDEWAL